MTYNKTTWVEDTTPLSPTNLNNIETGVADAHSDISKIKNGAILVKNADTLDGEEGTYYLDYNNLNNKPELSGQDASTLNGKTNAINSTPNTIAQRDGSGDLAVWCLRPRYTTANGKGNYFLTQDTIGNTSTNHTKPMTFEALRDKLKSTGGLTQWQITESTDLDNLTTVGFYACDGTCTHVPNPNTDEYGTLIVSWVDEPTYVQQLWLSDTGHVYYRVTIDGELVWTPWKRLLNQDDLDSLNTNLSENDSAILSLATELESVKQSGLNGKNSLETTIESEGGVVSKVGSVATFQELTDGIKTLSNLEFFTAYKSSAGDLNKTFNFVPTAYFMWRVSDNSTENNMSLKGLAFGFANSFGMGAGHKLLASGNTYSSLSSGSDIRNNGDGTATITTYLYSGYYKGIAFRE